MVVGALLRDGPETAQRRPRDSPETAQRQRPCWLHAEIKAHTTRMHCSCARGTTTKAQTDVHVGLQIPGTVTGLAAIPAYYVGTGARIVER